MADPITLATAALVVGGAGAGVSAIGAINSGNAAAANANYQAQVAKNNAITANQNADYAIQAGAVKTQETSLRVGERLAAARAGMAANGVDVNSGSAVDVQETQKEAGTLDTETEANNAMLQAYGYRTQATGYTAQSGLDTAEAGQASAAIPLNVAGGLLGSASSLGINYARLQQAGG